MFRVLIADDDFEDRELLKLEIQRAIGADEPDLRFHEAWNSENLSALLRGASRRDQRSAVDCSLCDNHAE